MDLYKSQIKTDIVVVGGGAAGIMAAMAGAKCGVNVLLIEANGFLGGTATAGLVTAIGGFHNHNGNKDIIGGLPSYFLNKLKEKGGVAPLPSKDRYDPWEGCYHFDPEIYKYVADEILLNLGVNLLFHTRAYGLEVNKGNIKGLSLMSKAGKQLVEADIFIDATGDGDLLAWSGLPYKDELIQASTLMMRVAGIDEKKLKKLGKETSRFKKEAKKIYRKWKIPLIWGFKKKGIHPGERFINLTRVLNVDGLDNKSLTRGEIEGRQQAQDVLKALNLSHPGFENAYLVQTSSKIGIRCTRRLIGEYCLTREDILSCHKFKDSVARGSWPVDIHNPAGEGTRLEYLPDGGAYFIPLRCFYNNKIGNLITCGRSLSATSEAHSSARIQATAMATGQAAGVLGALAFKKKKMVGNINPAEVQAVLRKWNTPI